MAFITDILNTIKNARKGKDMRQAIYDGIQQCYKDATGHPDSVAAVVERLKIEKGRIDELATSQTFTGNYTQSNLVFHAYRNAITGDPDPDDSYNYEGTSGKHEMPICKIFQEGTLDFAEKQSNEKVKILKEGLYIFELRIFISGSGKLDIEARINDVSQRYNAWQIVAQSTEETKIIAYILYLKGDDVVSFYGTPGLQASVRAPVSDVNCYVLDWIGKAQISDCSKEISDIRVGEDGAVYGTAGEAVRKQIGNITEDIGNLDDTVFNIIQELKDCTSDATILSDKFVSMFTGTDKSLYVSINDGKDLCDCYVISVNENDKFQVKGGVYNGNLYYPLIVMSSASFADNSIEQGSLVTAENGNYSYWGTGNATEIYEFVIPKGVKTLFVNKFSGGSEFLLKKYVDAKKSKIPTKISELENDTLFLSREMYTPQYNIHTGQIRSSGDFLPVYEVKDDGAYQVTEMIPVSKGDKVYYSGSFYSYPAVALYDKFGAWVSDLSGDLKIYVQYDNVEVREITCDGFVAAYSYKQVGGSNVKLALDVYGNKAQNEINSKYKMNYLYVATTGNDESGDGSASNPFASIYHANEIIHSNSPRNRFTIIVRNGTYTDLQERYSGIGSSGVYQGVRTKPYVYYQSETPERPDLCVIKWDGATGLTTPCNLPDVNEKAPFHVCGELLPFCMHTKIRGFTFDCKNTRYSAHIEMAGANFENEWGFENCIFKFSGRPDITDESNKTAPVVGIGSGFSESGMFKNCIFENLQSGYNQAINVHDNEFMSGDIAPYMLKGFTYTIDGCLFKSCNLIGLGSIHQTENSYDIDNILYIKQCSGIDTVNANENMKYKFIDN